MLYISKPCIKGFLLSKKNIYLATFPLRITIISIYNEYGFECSILSINRILLPKTDNQPLENVR